MERFGPKLVAYQLFEKAKMGDFLLPIIRRFYFVEVSNELVFNLIPKSGD